MNERSFIKLQTGFFTDPDMQALPDHAWRVFAALMIMSIEHNWIGCFKVAAREILHVVGTPDDAPLFKGVQKERDYDDEDQASVDRIKEALRILEKGNFIRRDRKSGWLWIRRFGRHNGAARFVWANIGALCEVPRDVPFFAEMVKVLREDIGPSSPAMIKAFDDAVSRDKRSVEDALKVVHSQMEKARASIGKKSGASVSEPRTQTVRKGRTQTVMDDATQTVMEPGTQTVSPRTTKTVSPRTTKTVSPRTTKTEESKNQEREECSPTQSQSSTYQNPDSYSGSRTRTRSGPERNSVTTEREEEALRTDRPPRQRAGGNPHGMVIERYFQIFEEHRARIYEVPQRVDPPRSQKDKIAAASWAEKKITPAMFDSFCEAVLGDMRERKPRDTPNSIRVIEKAINDWLDEPQQKRETGSSMNGTRSRHAEPDTGYQPERPMPFKVWLDRGRRYLRAKQEGRRNTWDRKEWGVEPDDPLARKPDGRWNNAAAFMPEEAWSVAQQMGPLAKGQVGTTPEEISKLGRKLPE